MLKSQKISSLQLVYLSFASAYGGVVFYHSYNTSLSGRTAWIAELLCGFLIIPFALWILKIGTIFPGKNIFNILEMLGGKIISTIFSIFYIAYNILLSVLLLRLMLGLIKSLVLHSTPIWATAFILVVMSSLIADSGVEVLARLSASLEVILLGILFFGLTMGLVSKFDISNILPIIDCDFSSFLHTMYMAGGGHSECILFMLIVVENLHSPSQNYKVLTKGLLISVVLMPGSVSFLLSATISPEEASKIAFAGINVAYAISMGKFIQGLEVFVVTTYVLITIMKLSGNFYTTWVASEQIFKKESRLILIIISAITLIGALRIPSVNEAFDWYILSIKYFAFPFYIAVLGLVSILIFIKGKKAVPTT